MMLHVNAMPPAFAWAFANPWSLTARAFRNPRVLGVPENMNRPDVQAAEIPAVNASARSDLSRGSTATPQPVAPGSGSPRRRWTR